MLAGTPPISVIIGWSPFAYPLCPNMVISMYPGGTVPMAATLASAAVFDSFLGDSKADALLHGHSYTAHPIGVRVIAVIVFKARLIQ